MLTKPQIISDESAVAYSIVVIICIFLLFTIIYILSTPAVNLVFTVFNADILPMGIVSSRTRDTLMWQRTVWGVLPFFVGIFLLLVYPIIRALMAKRAGGD